MWTLGVVLGSPGSDLSARVPQIPEPVHVQALIAQAAMEALHMRVLRGLAWLDVNRVDLVLHAPCEIVPGTHLRPVVAANRLRTATPFDHQPQSAREAAAGHRGIDLQRQALAREAIHHAEDP